MAENCWEFMECGREVGGPRAEEQGVCLAATETRLDGIHGGKNGGRACWAVCGTLCGGEVQGSFAEKMGSCKSCNFYKQVFNEDIEGFVTVTAPLKMLKEDAQGV
jgi:hypothetical protein